MLEIEKTYRNLSVKINENTNLIKTHRHIIGHYEEQLRQITNGELPSIPELVHNAITFINNHIDKIEELSYENGELERERFEIIRDNPQLAITFITIDMMSVIEREIN